MKLSVTIVLLSIASYAFAQSPERDSRSTKIDEDERKRLENQFKALNNFYINDDGLVVYQTQGNSTSQSQNDKTTSTDTTSQKTTSVPNNTKAEKSENDYLIKEDGEETKSTPVQKPLSTRIVSSEPIDTDTGVVSQKNLPARSTIIRKEALKPTEATERSTVSDVTGSQSSTSSTGFKNSPIITASEEQVDNSPKTSAKSATQANADTSSKTSQPKTTTSKKTSVFDKNKRPSQYKTMEEAALAVEALLDDLRKEQSQTTGAGSMSSRLSGGAGRATLRKKPSTNPSYSSSSSDNSGGSTTPAIINDNDDTSEFGTEPTYYINGKEVDKIEVNKLRKKEIISREVRTRNTVSGNPNGEVWFEVKYEN